MVETFSNFNNNSSIHAVGHRAEARWKLEPLHEFEDVQIIRVQISCVGVTLIASLPVTIGLDM
jgi:hypothetical protein